MQGFKAGEHVSKYYGSNPQFAAVLQHSVPGFRLEEWAELPLFEALGRLNENDRERAEDALNGWELPAGTMTPRQAQFVAEHSGEQRKPPIREALAAVGPEAMTLAAAGDRAGARRVLAEAGLSPKAIAVFLTGWEHDFMEHELDGEPAICAIVNAMTHKTYVGRVVRLDDDVLWQEVEPGQIVEHKRGDLGEIPAVMADPFYHHKNMREAGHDSLHAPWLNSWCIRYDGEGKASITTASLILFNAFSIKPNPFKGRIVSETGRRFVQQNDMTSFSGHLKTMTGDLEIGGDYELTYRGPMGAQTIDVKRLDVEIAQPAAPAIAPVVETAVVAAGAMPVPLPPAHIVDAITRPTGPGREWWKVATGEDVVGLCADICKRLDVVASPKELARCIEHGRMNESFSGRILEVDEARGLVVQSLGRRQATVHRLSDFAEAPAVGLNLDIKYRDGQLLVKDMDVGRAIAR